MTQNAQNIEGAITGAAYQLAVGATLPTDPVSPWPAGAIDLGYIDNGGVVESFSDSTTDVVTWQGHVLARRFISKSEKTFKFGLLESKGSVMNAFFKGVTITQSTVTVGGVSTPFWQFTELTPGALVTPWGFDLIDGVTHERLVVPFGEVTTRGAISYKADGAKVYEVTVTAYPGPGNVIGSRFSTNPAWGQS